jgi:hypothetical protein
MGTSYFLNNTVAQKTFETARDVSLPNQEYLDLSFQLGYEENLGNVAIESSTALVESLTGDKIVPIDQAKGRAKSMGLPENIFGDNDIEYDTMNMILDRQSRLKYVRDQLARPPNSKFTYAQSYLDYFMGSVSDAPSAALAVVTGGGSLVARGAMSSARAAALSATQGALTGIKYSAPTGLGYWGMANSIGDQYGVQDYIADVALGGLLGGLSGGVGSLVKSSTPMISNQINRFTGGKYGNALNKLSPEDLIEIHTLAARQVETGNPIKIEPVINAALKRKLMYNINQIETDPELLKLLEVNNITDIQNRAVDAAIMSDNPDFGTRQQDIELRLSQAKADYDEANLPSVLTAEQTAYGRKIELAAQTRDPRRKSTLIREAEELDEQSGGTLSVMRDRIQTRKNKAKSNLDSITQEQNDFAAQINLARQLKKSDMINGYNRDYSDALIDADPDPTTRIRQVREEANEIEKLYGDTELSRLSDKDLDDMVTAFDEDVDRIQSTTGVVFKQPDAEIDTVTIVNSVKNLVRCMVL